MGKYSIRDLEKLTGIKSHTLRIWEKRYDFLKTKRTDTNIRYYDDDDLKYVLNVAYLVNHGIKISKAAVLKEDELINKVKEISEEQGDFEFEINSFVTAMTDFDEIQFEKAISNCSIKYGLELTINQIIYPFLHRIGIMWQTGSINPAQEHFISNLIRQKILIAIDALPIPQSETTFRFLLFLPEDELQEIGLLFANYLIRKRGNHTLYLGQSVPLDNLVKVYRFYQPQYLFAIITNSHTGTRLQEYLNVLLKLFPETTILLSGAAVQKLKAKDLPNNMRILYQIEDTVRFLNSISQVPVTK